MNSYIDQYQHDGFTKPYVVADREFSHVLLAVPPGTAVWCSRKGMLEVSKMRAGHIRNAIKYAAKYMLRCIYFTPSSAWIDALLDRFIVASTQKDFERLHARIAELEDEIKVLQAESLQHECAELRCTVQILQEASFNYQTQIDRYELTIAALEAAAPPPQDGRLETLAARMSAIERIIDKLQRRSR